MPETVPSSPLRIGVDERAELLAAADPDELLPLADRLIERFGEPTISRPPETGLVMLQVREPVCRDRFQLDEVVVTRAEVRWDGSSGWAMRVGTDRAATLAAAICDAGAAQDDTAAGDVDELCVAVRSRHDASEAAKWAALASTTVNFEELD